MASPSGRVLVVDDDDLFLRVCGSLLRRAGHTVETVNNPAEALARVGRTRYDAIVSDVCMPEISGLSLLKAVRSVDATVPFVLMTGAPTMESAISAIDLGVHKYLPKPFDVDQFVLSVSEAVERRAVSGDLPSLHRRLDRALEGLFMVYQPIVEVSMERALAYEALLRTTAPDIRGPGDMLELAEKTGRLFDLGRAVRLAVSRDIVRLDPKFEVFVNLHPADLEDPELYTDHSPLVLDAKRVVFEITERASVCHDAALSDHMRELRARGYRVAVDDLGAGYAGLTTLASVQPEYVKLDGALVHGIDKIPVNQLIVAAVIHLAQELGCRVVAEFVETRAELATLRALGVDLMQGYLFARPARTFAAVDFAAAAAAAPVVTQAA